MPPYTRPTTTLVQRREKRKTERSAERILDAAPIIVTRNGREKCRLRSQGMGRGHSSSRQDCFHLEQERETIPVIDLAKSPYGAAPRFTKINLFPILYLRGRNILGAAANACLCVRARGSANFARRRRRRVVATTKGAMCWCLSNLHYNFA